MSFTHQGGLRSTRQGYLFAVRRGVRNTHLCWLVGSVTHLCTRTSALRRSYSGALVSRALARVGSGLGCGSVVPAPR